MRQLKCAPTTYVFSINEVSQLAFLNRFIQRNEHVEMNNFSCSLSYTWMTIIDCLFYASGKIASCMAVIITTTNRP